MPAYPIPVVAGKMHIATPSEMKRKWVQTSDGIYVSPFLARNKNGSRIVSVNWRHALGYAMGASRITGRTYLLASYAEALGAIKQDERTRQEATSLAEWTRNRYETMELDTRKFTRILGYGLGRFEDLNIVLRDGFVASTGELGAPDAVSDESRPDFLSAALWYDNKPVLRGWMDNFDANARAGAFDAGEDLGFRLVWYEKQQSGAGSFSY